MRALYYEPKHDRETRGRIEIALARRGYTITDDGDADVTASVYVTRGGWCVDLGDIAGDLAPLDQWESPEAYAAGIADWIECETAAAGIEPAGGAR